MNLQQYLNDVFGRQAIMGLLPRGLFVELARRADEHGQVRVNLSRLCEEQGIGYFVARRWVGEWAKAGILCKQNANKVSLITFYGLGVCDTSAQTSRNYSATIEDDQKKAETEKQKSSPCTPSKEEEREKKEAKQQQPALRFFASLSMTEEEQQSVLEQSRAALEKRVERYRQQHPEIPAAALTAFRDHWAEEKKVTTADGQLIGFCLAWDAAPSFTVDRRLPGFMRTGVFAQHRRELMLQRLNSPKTKSAAQQNLEARQAAAREIEEMEREQRRLAREEQARKAVTYAEYQAMLARGELKIDP